MTLMQTDPVTVQETSSRTVRRPKYGDVITAISAEAGCTAEKANEVYQFLARARDCIRTWCDGDEEGYTDYVYHLTDSDLSRYHDVLDAIMPDDTAPAPGSAYALLNRRLLRGNEVTFVHTKVGEEIVDCAVAVHINFVG